MEEEDDFDFYNPKTWLVAPESENADSPSISSLMNSLDLQIKKKDSPMAALLPERHPKYKVFIDEYRIDDRMDEIEHDFSNHIAAAYESGDLADIATSPQQKGPSGTSSMKGDKELADEAENMSPLNDVYASKPYLVLQSEDTMREEDEAMVERKMALARKRLADERGKHLVIGSELATMDPDVLLNAMLNPHEVAVPRPPVLVNALGRDSSASVWWQYEDLKNVPEEARVTAWEITRYRLSNGQWVDKGITAVKEPHEIDKCSCTIPDLQNGFMYKFTVMGRNLRGRGFESPLTDAVLVEADLPPGWFRFWDADSDRIFYSNLKTKQSSWTRPDEDPYYLDEEIVLLFSDAERLHLRKLYDDCIHLCTRISQHAFKAILLEVGEVAGISKIARYFFEFSTGGKEYIKRWDHFMLIMAAIKRKKMKANEVGRCQQCQNYSACLPCYVYEHATCCTRLSFFALLDGWNEENTEKNKYGAWVVEWSSVGERNCYRNTITDEIRWDAPKELRFYLPKRMEEKMLSLFSPQNVEDFKMRYSQYDQDGSGNIDRIEFKMLLEGMGIFINDRLRDRLINEIDLNRNGTIEFHEFCFLMMNLNNPNSTWNFLKKALPDPEVVRARVLERAPLVDSALQVVSDTASKGGREGSQQQGLTNAESSRSCGWTFKRSFIKAHLSVTHCCVDIITACHKIETDYRAAVTYGDEFMDSYLLCKRPFGEHGMFCMCGCRKIEEDHVFYFPFHKNEDEPLTWSSVCPCCDK